MGCTGALAHNHDGSFEHAYYWGLTKPPHYGAWGESYHLGAGTVECGVFWFTTLGYWVAEPIDLFVWDGGTHGPPTNLLWMMTEVVVPNYPLWPAIGSNEFEIGLRVERDFTVGYWSPSGHGDLHIAADENGSGGQPWTCIPPGLGYPSHWQHPGVVHPDCVSLGIGVTFTDEPTPAESETWGLIKSVFLR